jgi:CRP-like cAMP-binding protein
MTLNQKLLDSNTIPFQDHFHHFRSFKRGQLLPMESDILWQLDSGFIRTVAWQYEGQAATLGIWGPGDFLGRVGSPIEECQLECLTSGVFRSISMNQFPHHALYEATILHLERSQTLLNILHCRPMPLRLMKLLIWLAHRFGNQVERGWILDLRLTHQVIAESIGTTRVTVTRLLQSFEKDGRLKRLQQYRYLLNSIDITLF